MRILVQRKHYTAQSTTGEMFLDDKFFAYTLERPRVDFRGAEAPFCIIPGTYQVKIRFSPHFGYNVLGIENVPGRTDIEVHIANFPKDIKGCIGVGQTLGKDFVGSSKIAFETLMREAQKANDIELTIY